MTQGTAMPLSVEGRIESGLRENQINAREFVDLAEALHVQIGHGTFSEALNCKRTLDRETGEKLLELLNELKLLRATYPNIPINWARTNQVAALVVLARVEKIAAELDQEVTREPQHERGPENNRGEKHADD